MKTFCSFAMALMLAVGSATAASTDGSAAPQKLSRTVGLDIVRRTANPDKTTSLTFGWTDKGGAQQERTVVVNGDSIILVHGEIMKFADVPEGRFKEKCVATVGPDNVSVVLLRFGRSNVPQEQLTPKQLKLLLDAAPPATEASNAALEKRVTGLVESLRLEDAAKRQRIHGVLSENLRMVRDSHNAGMKPVKAVREKLIIGLEADLTPEQVDDIKDKLTEGKLPFTYKAYHAIVPNLTPEQDRKILGLLKQAREECLDVKNSHGMAVVFEKYKTQCENYLKSEGYDWRRLYKEYVTAHPH